MLTFVVNSQQMKYVQMFANFNCFTIITYINDKFYQLIILLNKRIYNILTKLNNLKVHEHVI